MERVIENCNAELRTSRKDRFWYCVRGKGFIIWLSDFYPSKENNQIRWLSDIEVHKNAPKIAFDTLAEILHGATKKFYNMSLENF